MLALALAAAVQFPELARDRVVPPIILQLRSVLRDPHSMIDLAVCEPVKVKVRDGRPVRWTVMFSVNARNGFGGYTGSVTYGAIFRPDQAPEVVQIWAGSTGCPLVPPALIAILAA